MTTSTSTDAELVAQARQGDETAFAELYVRHEAAARRLANAYARAGDPDDLVNGAFERVLKALRKGLGPTEAFRAYLFVTLRRLAADRIARAKDELHDEVPEPVRAESADPVLDAAERSLVVRAYESLADRWQMVLWHTAVEGRAPRELAPTLGMTPNAAAALAYRAREKLRQAYLQAHLQATPRPECEPHRSRLGAYVRDGLGVRDRGNTAAHLDDCGSCRGLLAELADVNRLLVRSLVPIFASAGQTAALLAASTGAAAGAGAAAATAGAGAGADAVLRGVGDLGRRTWSRARSNPAGTTVLVGALLVLAVVAGALIASRGERPPPPAPEAAAPAGDPAPPEVPMEVAPPAIAEPIVSAGTTLPETEVPAPVDPDPSQPPPSAEPPGPRPSTPRSVPDPSTTVPDPTDPPQSVPTETTEPPTTAPPPSTSPPPPTTAPPADEPCLLYVWIGGVLHLELCLDLPLLGGLGLTADGAG